MANAVAEKKIEKIKQCYNQVFSNGHTVKNCYFLHSSELNIFFSVSIWKTMVDLKKNGLPAHSPNQYDLLYKE